MPITNPTDIPGLIAWYDARLETGVADGGTLTQMTDQSGLGNHALATGTPKWAATGGPDGGARYDFDGTGSFVLPSGILALTNLSDEVLVQSGTSYTGKGAEVVATIKAGGTGQHWQFSGEGTNQFADPAGLHPSFASIVMDGFGSPRGGANSGGSPLRHMMPLPVGDTAWHLYDLNSWGANTSGDHYARIDGVVQNWSTFTGTGGSMPNFQAAPEIGSSTYTGDFGCIVLFSRRLTAQERADLQAWLGMPSRTLPAGGTFQTPIQIVPDGTGAYTSDAQPQVNFATVTPPGQIPINESVWWSYTAPVDSAAKVYLDFSATILDGIQNYTPQINIFVGNTKKNTSQLNISSGTQMVVLDPGQTVTVGIGNAWTGYSDYYNYNNTNPPANVQYVLKATTQNVTKPANDSRWAADDLVFVTDKLTASVDATLLGVEPDEPSGTDIPYATAWWKYTPDVNTRLDLNTYGSYRTWYVNMVRNPDGTLGAGGTDGWTAVTSGSLMYKGDGGGSGNSTIAYRHVNAASTPGTFRTELMAVTAGKYLRGQYAPVTATSNHYVTMTLDWYDASQVLLSSGGPGTGTYTGAGRRTTFYGYQVPAGAAYVAMRFDLYGQSYSTTPPAAFAYMDLYDVVLEQIDTANSMPYGLSAVAQLWREDAVGVLTRVVGYASPSSVNWRTGNRLIANLDAGKTYYLQIGDYYNETIPLGQYKLAGTRTTLPPNDKIVSATPIAFSGTEYVSPAVDSTYLTTESIEGESSSTYRSAWWQITPSQDIVVDFDTAQTTGNADISTQISVFTEVLSESFEDGEAGWTPEAGNSTIVASTAQAYDGASSLEVTTVNSVSQWVWSDPIPVNPSDDLMLKTQVLKGDGSSSYLYAGIGFMWLDSGGTMVSYKDYNTAYLTTAAPGWTQVGYYGTAPATAASVQIGLYGSSPPVGQKAYYDAIVVRKLVARGTSSLTGVTLQAGKKYLVKLAQTGTQRNLQYVLHAVNQSVTVEPQPTQQTIDLVTFTGDGTFNAATTVAVKRTAAFQGSGTLVVKPKPRIIANFGGDGVLEVTAERVIVPELWLMLLDTQLNRAPGPITVALIGGFANADVTFSVNGVDLYTATLDTDGTLAPTSINLPDDLLAGTYTLVVSQTGSTAGSADFTLAHDPPKFDTARGPDAQAVDVPGAAYGDRRHWVLQDLMPGGLGSWIMPISPAESSSPYFERQLASKSTTAGRVMVTEGAQPPVEWTFSGLAPDEDFAGKLTAYVDLNRRCYVIDHRGRAFKVVFLGVDLRPRMRRNFNGTDIDGYDYTVTALVLDQDWVTPA